MGAFEGETLADRFRNHFGHTDHLYGAMLAGMADDWEVGGVTREIFAGWEDEPARQFPQLRMLAGLFRIVLRGDAPQLEGFYPALGGDLDHHDAWAVARPVLGAHAEELHESLRETPQTNEPARTAALLVGLGAAVRRTGLRRVRLLEPGASAGLGLLVDHYRFLGDGWAAGPESSPLVVSGCEAAGFVPEPVEVVARRGCDVAPVDAGSDEGADYLTSFVWPWQLDRHARLAAALRVAREHPVVVDRAPASAWVAERLAEPVGDDVLTVVWHSVTRLYWPRDETVAMTAAVDEARQRVPVVHIAMEHRWQAAAEGDDPGLPLLTLDDEVLATCDHHGPPIRLAG
jgi:hypothetical protein